MTIGYYPGCSLTGTSREYDMSLRHLLKELGVEFREIDDWSCCGASSAHISSHLLSVALPARNLQLAAEQGFDEILAPCAACYNRLAVARHAIDAQPEIREKIEYVLEKTVDTKVKVRNIIDLLEGIGTDLISAKVSLPLRNLKVACYYGCLLVRPSYLGGCDDTERPHSMERLLSAVGAVPVDWNHKTECCGAAHSIARTDIVLDLSAGILEDAGQCGAEAVVVACPMCHSNLDMRQKTMRRRNSAHRDMPVLYLSEIIGLALGVDRAKLGLNLHFIDPSPVLARAGKEEARA